MMTERPSASEADQAEAAFLTELGQRVRRMRAVRGMSRKVLATASGISERYIAQLESGQGNVSIVLLRRVAQATGARLEDLIAQEGQQTADIAVIRAMLNEAKPQTLQQVKALLNGASAHRASLGSPNRPLERIGLIGLRGAGKSTLGRRVADELGWRFVELNRAIEQQHGLSVAEIFALYGQEGYRRLEQSVLRRIIAEPGPMILATGGGIVADPLTFDLLLSSCFTVWIKASPDEHMSRVRQQGDLRPMANDRAAMEELITILSSREPLYARANGTIDTAGRSLEQSTAALVNLIRQQQELMTLASSAAAG